MHSQLRHQTLFEPFSAEATQSHFVSSPPQKKQKMSLTQTYYIAASARSKLGREAGKADHNLRLLVGHANLLDSLMVELADAERDQEAWFNQTVKKARAEEQPKHIQWVDTIEEEAVDEEEDSDSDSDSGSDYDDADYDMIAPLRRIPSPPVRITTVEYDEDSEEEYEDDEDDEEHALERVPSSHTMPDLIHEDDSSDDESPPSSPPALTMEFTEAEREALTTTSFYDKPAAVPASKQEAFAEDGFFIPRRSAPMIASY